MRFLTRLSLRNPAVIFILTALVAIGGVLSSAQLKEELMPDISFPILGIMATYPGAAPSVVAKDVTEPLEKALQSISGVQDVLSNSVQNVSEIQVELSLSADLSSVQQKVQQAVNQVQLPATVSTPTVQQFSFNSQPILYYTIAANQIPFSMLKQWVQNSVVPGLQSVAGVGSVNTSGAAPNQVVIQFNEAQLAAHHLTAQGVLQDLQSDNVTMPLGSTTFADKVLPVQLQSSFTTLATMRSLRIPVPASPTAGFQAIGTSIGQMGKAVGQLAQGEAQLAQGIGKVGQSTAQVGGAVGKLGQGLGLVQAENELLTNITGIQGQIMGVQMALAEEFAKPSSARNPAKLLQYAAQIQGLQQVEKKLFAQLKKLTALLPAPQQNTGHQAVGTVNSGGSAFPATGALSGMPSHSSLTVPTTSGKSSSSTATATIALSQVATVNLQPAQNAAINRTNGERSVLVSVVKTDSANTVTTAQGVKSEMQTLQASLPAGAHITTLYDASASVVTSISGMVREAILGAIFAAIVILLFLRNALTTLIAVISIPLSLLIAMIFLNEFSVTLNIMTLGGMAVATGRVVDDSIVVIENIYRTWRRGSVYGKGFVFFAQGEVGLAITSSTITTIAVFLPLGLVSGIVGKVFFPFAMTVVFSLISSLIVALTIVPLLAWLFIARKAPKGLDQPVTEYPTEQSNSLLEAAFVAADEAESGQRLRPWQSYYRRTLNWCLNHKGIVVLFTVIAFVASTAVLPLVGSTFLPQQGDQYATISVSLPTGSPLSATDAKAQQVAALVTAQGAAVVTDNIQVGSDSGKFSPTGPSGSNHANFFIKLAAKANVNDFITHMRAAVKPLTGKTVIQVNSVSFSSGGGNFDLIVSGPHLAEIKQAAVAITNRLQGFSGLANVQNNLTATQPQVSVHPDMAKLASYNLSPYQIASVVRNYLDGQNIGNVELNGNQYPMVMQVKQQPAIQSLTDMGNLPIQTPAGQMITLSDVASLSIQQTPVAVLHRDGVNYAEVTGDFTTQNTGKTTTLAQQAVAALHLPNGVSTSLSGGGQQQSQSFTELIEAVMVAAGMVYIVMLIAFGEWTAPFAILFSMPVALIGAFLGTWIGHQPISVSSLIGILMLMGIVVTNAIVLISRVEQQRLRGMSVRDSLLEAGTTRLRPILMTAIATICALAPLAAGLSEGALISQGLAVVVIGGLTTSTILTLIIVPLVYELLHYRVSRRERTSTGTVTLA